MKYAAYTFLKIINSAMIFSANALLVTIFNYVTFNDVLPQISIYYQLSVFHRTFYKYYLSQQLDCQKNMDFMLKYFLIIQIVLNNFI